MRFPKPRHYGGIFCLDRLRNPGGRCSAVRRYASDAVVSNHDIDVLELVRTATLPVARRVDQHFLLRLRSRISHVKCNRRDGLGSSRDQLKLSIVEKKNLRRVTSPGRCIGRFIGELDCRAGGSTISVDRHRVEYTIHHEITLLAIRPLEWS